MKFDTFDFQQTKNWLKPHHKKDVLALIESCFNGVSADGYFDKYFSSDLYFERKLRLYYSHGECVGYCLITFLKKQKDVLLKASAAFYPKYRKGGNTFSFAITQAFRYWINHPFQSIFYADTMLSPAMYRATAKKAAIAWPSLTSTSPAHLFEKFNAKGNISKKLELRCLKLVDRTTNYSFIDIKRFKESKKPEIAFYCKVNPDFDKGTALFVIIPISLKQFYLTALHTLKLRFNNKSS